MDKLAKQLRDDANSIKCEVSTQLDDRIRASLEGMQPDAARQPRRESKSSSFWWASSLTGVAAATAVIALINLQEPAPGPAATEPVPQALQIPSIEWNAQAAVLTSPLEQEYEKLQADLEKAEEAVKQDIDRLF
jgi:hypothetical protein